MASVENELINYYKSLGIDVNTETKARGHQGFFLKNRIDISKNISQERVVPTLLHEFAHYVHSKLEVDIARSGGSLEVLFDCDNEDAVEFENELLRVTYFVDANSKCDKLNIHKKIIKDKILEYEKVIKSGYPKFMRSKKFKEFDKYIKNSKAKYLLKYDRVKLVSGVLFKKTEMFSIDNIEKDFSDMKPEFVAYIRLKSCQKRLGRVSARINKYRKYYSAPAELFARFIEGLYLDPERVKFAAPRVYERFFELLNLEYYPDLANAFDVFYNPVNL